MLGINDKLQQSIKFTKTKILKAPKVAIILGSGLGDFADKLKNATFFSTKEIPYYPQSTVEGHAGVWFYGQLQGKSIIALKGRVHFYEGYSFEEVTFPTRLLANLGVKYLIITNAAGSLNPLIRPGDLMLIDDHINLFFQNPLIGFSAKNSSERFVDMSQPYDQELMTIATDIAVKYKISIKKGVLIGSTGPTYETAAEVRMMQKLGGDAGTMSTIPEVIVATQAGLKVLGVSCITNMTTGLSGNKLNHKEVTEVAKKVANKFQKLIEETIIQIYNKNEN